MSIIAYTGLPGHGKSYGVVENVVIPALKQGRHIVTNMPLDREALIAEFGGGITFLPERCTAHDIPNLVPAGAVFVGDEVWRYWPSGLVASSVPSDQQEFFAMHRHRVGEDGFSTEIVLVTQDLSQVANFIRALVEQTFRVQKLTAVGSTKRYRVDVYEGAVTGPKPPVSRRLREIMGKYKPEIYKFYKSHTQSETGSAGSEQKADKRGSVLRSWRFMISVAALLVLPLMVFPIWNFFHPKPKHTKGQDSAHQAASSGQAIKPLAPTGPVLSKQWRLVGRIIVNKAVFFLADSHQGPRRINVMRCHQDEAQNWVCLDGGEVITEWSGEPPPIINSSYTAALPNMASN